VHDSARKDVSAGCEVSATRAPHEQQLPRLLAARKQYGRGGSRSDRRPIEVESARGQWRNRYEASLTTPVFESD
jgi:hypothetical protein